MTNGKKYFLIYVLLCSALSCAQGHKEWSILILTLESRKKSFTRLYHKLTKQIMDHNLQDKIEILVFSDNRQYTIGYKRNSLMAQSSGKYVNFIDDDDDISDQYIPLIYQKLLEDPDCVNLIGIRTVNGKGPKKFIHSIRYTHYFQQNKTFYRPPNHLNTIRRSIALQFQFPETNHGEDTDWAMQIARSNLLQREAVIETPLYYYLYKNRNKKL